MEHIGRGLVDIKVQKASLYVLIYSIRSLAAIVIRYGIQWICDRLINLILNIQLAPKITWEINIAFMSFAVNYPSYKLRKCIQVMQSKE